MTDGIHGFLVPQRDGKAIAEALAVLAGDRERISWMSRACKRRIRAAFSIERLAQELALHYGEMCGGMRVAGFTHGGPRMSPTVPRPRTQSEKLKD